ncbi:hypothetical protein [Chitinophaga qingshengii]|uniref:Uncharacterized protein n=1 Tax=Chitinophaga qingshengii TaxID=1569794 RepID=A0ABR7TG78_9BACT|nr:hypothetical protein [Chitinophaga qingshengii]MBC9929407.1 hypothetical protein [Chitinophaga qingshengii]
MKYRIDFSGPEQTIHYTTVCHSTLEVETLIRQVLQYDWSDENGSYALTLYDLSSGDEKIVHVYRFKMEPPHTKAAFEAQNARL